MNGPKLISSHFNYNDTDNNIIRVWYPTMREIPLPPLSYDQWANKTNSRETAKWDGQSTPEGRERD